jgi:hypothetical protein
MNGTTLPHFALGGILRARWEARLETPLCIKSGTDSAFNPSRGGDKTRNVNMGFRWQKEKTDHEVQVSELNYAVEVAQGRAIPLYRVFSRSFRGALRGWTIRHLVQADNQSLLDRLTEHTEDQTQSERAPQETLPEPGPLPRYEVNDPTQANQVLQEFKTALKTDPGLVLVYEVFGIAAKSDPGGGTISKQGNLKVEVSFSGAPSTKPQVQGDWQQDAGNSFGPGNAERNISVRGPLCRITQAARSGGLHYFLEFSPGQQMDITLTLRKPHPSHAGLLALWEREINAGLLRLGGLSSIGRGRLSLSQAEYDVIGTDAFIADWPSTSPYPVVSTDVFADIWSRRGIGKTDMDGYLGRLAQAFGNSSAPTVEPGA